jgi:hypothetical protein
MPKDRAMRSSHTALHLALAAPSGRIQFRKSPTDRSRWSSIWLMTLALSVSACAHTPHALPAKEPAMNTPDATTATNPTLTAEDVGKRFLKLIGTLRSPDDLDEALVKQIMGLTLKPSAMGSLINQPLTGDWVYVLYLVPESPGRKKGVILEFINKADRGADMSPVCGLNFEGYHNALKEMGYQEQMQYDEIGRLTHIVYRKDDFLIGLTPELKSFSDGKAYPTCVQRIGL